MVVAGGLGLVCSGAWGGWWDERSEISLSLSLSFLYFGLQKKKKFSWKLQKDSREGAGG